VTARPYYQDDLVTLYHGDCREQTAWLEADVLVTDPPYGISYSSGGARKGYPNRMQGEPIANDIDTSCRDTIIALWEDRPALVFGTWRVPRPASTCQILVWWKREPKNLARHGGRAWASNWEEIYVLGRWPKCEGRQASHGVIPTDEHRSCAYGAVAVTGHPTPKPLVLMESLIRNAPAGVIADPFAGSGSTLVACRALKRSAIGVELDERYCEITARRLDQGVLDFGDGAA
jgi:site-specific DNA-methyltransferase (adenine-specific)